MKKIFKVKLYLDQTNGSFTAKEIIGAPYITAEQEVEMEPTRVAFIDVSGSQTEGNVNHYINKAKEMGIKKCAAFDTTVSEIMDIDEFDMTRFQPFQHATKLGWLDSLDEYIIPVIFTDGEIQDLWDMRKFLSTRGIELYLYDEHKIEYREHRL